MATDTIQWSDERTETPGDVPRRDWKAALKGVGHRYKEHRLPLAAGGIAYYSFLALFPGLIALVAVVALVGLGSQTTDTIVNGAQQALPPGASDVITRAVENASTAGGGGLVALVVSAAVALFAATKGMVSVQQGLDIAYEVDADEERGFLAARAIAVVMLAATAVLGLSAAALVVFGAPIGQYLNDLVPVGDEVFRWGWTVVRWVTAVLLISVLFSLLYYIGPSVRPSRWRWVTPGGLLAGTLWAAASLGFSFYVTELGSFGDTYGALAGVVVFIMWLYITALATLLGGELNAALERRS